MNKTKGKKGDAQKVEHNLSRKEFLGNKHKALLVSVKIFLEVKRICKQFG